MKEKVCKVFVSLPMRGLEEDEILAKRSEIVRKAADMHLITQPFEIIENYSRDGEPTKDTRLWYLGRSIQDMAEADVILFDPNYGVAKGCLIERQIVEFYKEIYKWDAYIITSASSFFSIN